MPGTDGSLFTNLGIHPAVNDDGRVAFVANSEPGRGIYSVAPNGDIEILADDVEVVTSTNVSFNNVGRLAFIPGLGNIRQSVQLSAGEGDVVPFATAANGFQNFGDVSEDDNSPVISDRGDVAFLALTQAGNLGILNGPSPTGNMAIQVGDPLFGSTVTFLTFGAINASGQIAFRAFLLDGREVVAVATPPAMRGRPRGHQGGQQRESARRRQRDLHGHGDEQRSRRRHQRHGDGSVAERLYLRVGHPQQGHRTRPPPASGRSAR